MGKFYQKERHKQDPNWLRGIQKYVEKANASDVKDTIRNYGGDEKTTAKASYDTDGETS